MQPSVSTAVSRRMTAWRLLIFVTPMDSTTVTTVARPSGIAATARDTATMKLSSMDWAVNFPAIMRSNTNMNRHMPSTILDKELLSWPSLRCKGVSSCSVWAKTSAILPISVSMPVEVTTALPLPYTTVEPM